MESIRIQRLRCLSDTGEVKIKPITVLLGENNSGKSTFLRFFPLLKQSIETRTSGPILWNGHLVDFGLYEDAHQQDSDRGISFSFHFLIKGKNRFSFLTHFLGDLEIKLNLEILEDKKQNTIVDRVQMNFADSEIELKFDEDKNILKFQINSLDILSICDTLLYTYNFQDGVIIPHVYEKSNFIFNSVKNPDLSELILQEFNKKIKAFYNSSSDASIHKIYNSLGIGYWRDMLEKMKDEQIGLTNLCSDVNSWTVDNPDFQEIRDLIIAKSILPLLYKCDLTLNSFSKNISYIAPIRATTERYYRMQNLAIDGVDPQGRNLTTILHNLPETEIQNFTNWTLQNFGFKIYLESSLGHLSVYLELQNSTHKVNIADAGFGFSQLLPIITQLWFLSEHPRYLTRWYRADEFKPPTLFAIEQPELHLHPRFQGLLIEAFVTSIQAARELDIDLRLVIETHSEVLINKLGHLVADRKIDPEDINIVLFEKSQNSPETIVRCTNFDENGYLSEDWPLGFFDLDLM